jgi:hypothetical protein
MESTPQLRPWGGRGGSQGLKRLRASLEASARKPKYLAPGKLAGQAKHHMQLGHGALDVLAWIVEAKKAA